MSFLAPADTARLRRFAAAVSCVPGHIEAEAPGVILDIEGSYSADGDLISARLGGWDCPPHILEQILGTEEFERIATMDSERLSDAIADMAEDALHDWADHQNDMRRDR